MKSYETCSDGGCGHGRFNASCAIEYNFSTSRENRQTLIISGQNEIEDNKPLNSKIESSKININKLIKYFV